MLRGVKALSEQGTMSESSASASGFPVETMFYVYLFVAINFCGVACPPAARAPALRAA